MSKYVLKFSGKKGVSDDKTDFSVSTVQISNPDTHLNVPNPAPSGLESIRFQLTELRYSKSNYAPCRVDAVITVSECPSDAGIDEISSIFTGKTVGITNQAQIQYLPLDPVTVGSDYFVYQASPVFQFDKAKGDTVPCTVSLVIYSRDYLLTLNRFSKSYLSQKLSSDILASTLKYSEEGEGGVLGGCMVDFESDIDRLQFTVLEDKELIQPYHVQYNEDFYSFIARIAARHGEFLFFEDGKLNLGLPHGKDAISLDRLSASDNSAVPVVLSMEREAFDGSPLEVDSYYSNYLYRDEDMFDTIFATSDVVKDQREVAGKPIDVDSKKLYFNEDAYDEYFDVIGTTTETAPDGMIMEQGGGFWLKLFLTKILPLIPSTNHDTKFSRLAMLAEALKEITFEETALLARVTENNEIFLNKRVNVPVAHKDDQYGGNDGDKVCQFGTYTSPRSEGSEGEEQSLQQYNFMKAFYASLRKSEMDASKRVVKMNVRPGCAVLNVGDTVSFGKKTYIILKVSAGYSFKPAEDTVSIDVMEIEEADKPICPPYDKCSEHSKATPQTAVVANHLDPRYLNRVRIKYPWQPDSDLASPWVRTSTPMASPNGAGASFVMRAGSEVMVDYIDGNIDRPYIVGSLFNTRNNPTCFPLFYGDREIRAESGARLQLGMGNIATHAKNFVPFMSVVTPFISPLMGQGMVQLANWMPMMGKLAGTATLTDGFGLFTISGDTAARAVTIDSAIGTVSISALTGITISAPFGDVTIEGHNIKLKAANNLTLESGLNIKDELDVIARQKRHKRLEADPATGKEGSTAGLIGKGMGDIAAKTLADLMLGAIDMSLPRIIYNAVTAPKEGTLKIKSHRFVNIEAGDGRAMDRAGGFVPLELDVKYQVTNVNKFSEAAMESLKKRIVALRTAYQQYELISPVRKYKLKKSAEEIIRDCLKNTGASFTEKDLYENINPVLEEAELLEEVRELATDALLKSSKALRKYFDDYKKASGTFKGGIKPFTSEQKNLLCSSMDLAISEGLMTRGEKAPDLTMRLIQMGADVLPAEMNNFKRVLFRVAVLKCIGTKGFSLKWNEGYVLGRITVSHDAVEPWADAINNINISFDDMAYMGHKVIRENFKNPFSIEAGTVNSVWHPLQKGRVLISETPGTTLGITPNHNEWEAMDNQSVEFIRRYLAQR